MLHEPCHFSHCQYTVKLEHGPENCHDQTPLAILNADNVFFFRQTLKTKQQCFTMLYLDSLLSLESTATVSVCQRLLSLNLDDSTSQKETWLHSVFASTSKTLIKGALAHLLGETMKIRQQAPGELQWLLKNLCQCFIFLKFFFFGK